MDSQYVSRTLALCLSQGLAELIEQRPPDPIDFLALWILKYKQNQELEQQVDHAKVLHYVGAGLAFPGSLLFVCVQTLLSYRAAETQRDFQTAHLRLTLTALSFATLILSGVFFIQESFVLQHAAAILEWMFAIIVLVFYSSFSLEFGSISSETLGALMTRRDGASEEGRKLEKV